MYNERRSKFTYKVGQWTPRVATGVAIMLGVMADVQPQQSPYNTWPEILLSAIKFLNDWSLPLYGIMPLLFFVGWYLKRNGDPWVWEKIQYLLDGIDKQVFHDLTRDKYNRHRVTLFQRKQFVLLAGQPVSSRFWPYGKGRHPWSGWLKPVLRSGHTARTARSIFYAPSGKDSHNVEGVVGQAWAENKTIIVDNLPNIRQNVTATKEKYAKETWCAIALVDRYAARKQPPPRSIGAIPITVSGKVWGALVFDSKDSKGITHEKANQYTLTFSLIGQLLEKV